MENETKDLEYAVVHNGFFLDYWAPQAEKSNMTPFTLFIDIPNDSAAIPGSGNVPSAFTHTRDVAKFVAAALDLKKWDNDLFIVGDKVTWNEFLKLAEDAKGKSSICKGLPHSLLITPNHRHKVQRRLRQFRKAQGWPNNRASWADPSLFILPEGGLSGARWNVWMVV